MYLINIPLPVYNHCPQQFHKLEEENNPEGIIKLAESVTEEVFGNFDQERDADLEIWYSNDINEIYDMLNSSTNVELTDYGNWFVFD